MLKPEQRQILVNYLAEKASDTVLMEAFENARREFDHATVTIGNFTREGKPKESQILKPLPTQAVNTEVIVMLVPDASLPSKFTVVGKEVIDVLNRKGAPMNLADIAKAAHRSITQTRPQLAVAVKRGLVVQLRTDLFEAK